jgi:restriction endonuclease S subunit
MTPDRLLAQYDRVADAPDAVPRLRRFILDLAVRGKLVPQDLNDEPASELLKRIAKEKARSEKQEPRIPQIETAGELIDSPRNWSLVPLIVLGSWAIGAGFPKNEQGFDEGPYFFLKVSDMNLPGNEKYIITSNNCIDAEAAARMRAKIHPPGTIIFPKIGGAIATNKRRVLTKGAAIDNNCLGITFSNELDTEWAYLLLTTLDFTQYQAGTAVPALQQGVLERIPVGLPPLSEQYRIVAKVDELMALCDQLEAARAEREATRDRLAAASLARLNAPDPDTFQDDARFALEALPALTTRPDQIKQLRQTILNLAVRGKLVPHDPKEEPAVETLKRIAKEKARCDRKERKQRQQLNRNETRTAQIVLPSGWALAPLSDLVTILNGRAYKQNELLPAGTPVLRVGNLFTSDKWYYSDLLLENDKYCEDGDLIFAWSASFGPFIWHGGRVIYHYHIWKLPLHSDSDVDKLYLYNFLLQKTREIKDAGHGISMIHMTKEKMEQIEVPLPPLAEQHRIVAKVDELMALCDKLETSLASVGDVRRRLLEVLLAEALEPAADHEREAA